MQCHKFKVNKKIMLFHLILLFTIGISFGQNNLKNGYIITLENDTIQGQIEYRSNSKQFKSCRFKNGQMDREFFPDELIGFGFDNGGYFTSQIISNQFVEALVVGKISLFKSEFKFHVKKDSLIYDLESVKEYVYVDGRRGVKDDNKWRGVTASLISDCLQNSNEIISRIILTDRSLTNLVLAYNNCSGKEYVEYKTDIPWTKFEFGATIGIANSDIIMKDKSGNSFFLDDYYSSFDPTFGVLLGLNFPKISDKFSLNGEVHYQQSNYSSLVVFNRPAFNQYFDTYIHLSTLSIPISVKYDFPEKKYGAYLQGGFNYNYQLSSDTRLLVEREVNNVVTTSQAVSAFEIFDNQIGYWGGGGLYKSYGKIKLNIALRYIHMSRLNRTGTFRAINNKLSLNLILMKK
jgi:hypothetical protein